MSMCSAKIGNTSATFAYNAVAVYYNQIASLKTDPQGYVWNALNTPFVQTIAVVMGSRIIPGHTTSETHETVTNTTNQRLADCQPQHGQIDTLIALQQAALQLQKQDQEQIAAVLSVLSVLSDQQGETHKVSFQATEDGQNPTSAGACSDGATPDGKRDEEARDAFVFRDGSV
ncbi:hypothetical protein BDV97DRAFT_363500 [Delphinella strobiligena]|nr:hypothetical protein BDV97DRAFT_363500 [Delphinella strobiligena]